MQRLARCDTLMEILQDITGQGNGIIVDELQALVGAGGIFLRVDIHHMPLQLRIMHGNFHTKAHKSPFQGFAAGEEPFVKPHSVQRLADGAFTELHGLIYFPDCLHYIFGNRDFFPYRVGDGAESVPADQMPVKLILHGEMIVSRIF